MTMLPRRLAAAAFALLSGLAALGAAGPKAVATTAWTAAFCRAAGLEDVRVLAPATLQHPPDYALRPSDIPALEDADIIVFGGYEGMMDRIRSQVAGSDTVMLRIGTAYAMPVLEESIRAIAAAAGTEAAAEENLAEIRSAWNDARRMIADAGLTGAKAAVHFHQKAFATAAGLETVMEFGPAPPGPRLIAEAGRSGAAVILDNWHNPMSAPLQEVTGVPAAELINFPGREGTESLADVIRYNARVLVSAVN